MHHSAQGISVLICTYNGAKNITATLDHLARQQVARGVALEVLLVDNASTDNTGAVAQQYWNHLRAPYPLRVIREPRTGKNNAMDSGLAKAGYEYLLICDDDNWLEAHYVQRAFDIMHSDPAIGMLGGRGIPVFEGNKPVWFDAFENYYAVGRQNAVSGEVTTSKGFLWGAGTVLNRAAYRKLLKAGFRRVITYEEYPRIARGEDVELCLAVRLAGYKIWYDEQLVFSHYISASKLSWSYLTRLVKEGAAMGVILQPYRRLLKNPAVGLPAGETWLKGVLRHLYGGIAYRNWKYMLPAFRQPGQTESLKWLSEWQQLKAMLTFNKKIETVAVHVSSLAEKLRNQ
jgi:glycosyltransferase involved in cell wall biosynthesis